MTPKEKELLESLIDHYTLTEVVEELANIAYEKAEHVRSNWNDKPLEKAWNKIGNDFDKMALKIQVS